MAQDFLPYDIHPGSDLDATKVQKNFEAVEAKFPLRGKDIAEVFGNIVNWSGVTIPTDAINVDELFNAATGIARALGCLDIIRGMRLIYDSPTTFRVDVGALLHRNEFKTREAEEGDETCRGPASCFGDPITPGDILIPGECEPTEMNPSGLDYDGTGLWYFVYAKLDIAGSAPELRVSDKAPVVCQGKGPEHPTNNKLRYIGALRTIANGEIRPFIPWSNGWTFWADAEGATTDRDNTGNFVKMSVRPDAPPTADCVQLEARHKEDGVNNNLRIRPTKPATWSGPFGEGYRLTGYETDIVDPDWCLLGFAGGLGGAIAGCITEDLAARQVLSMPVPINLCQHEGTYDESQPVVEMGTIEYKGADSIQIDVMAYHEPFLR